MWMPWLDSELNPSVMRFAMTAGSVFLILVCSSTRGLFCYRFTLLSLLRVWKQGEKIGVSA